MRQLDLRDCDELRPQRLCEDLPTARLAHPNAFDARSADYAGWQRVRHDHAKVGAGHEAVFFDFPDPVVLPVFGALDLPSDLPSNEPGTQNDALNDVGAARTGDDSFHDVVRKHRL